MNDKIERTRAQWLREGQRWLPMLDSIEGDTVEEVVTLPADDYDALKSERDAAIRERDELLSREPTVNRYLREHKDDPELLRECGLWEVRRLRELNDEAIQRLRNACEAIEDLGVYVDEYWKEKHNYYSDLAKITEFLARIDKENGDERRD